MQISWPFSSVSTLDAGLLHALHHRLYSTQIHHIVILLAVQLSYIAANRFHQVLFVLPSAAAVETQNIVFAAAVQSPLIYC